MIASSAPKAGGTTVGSTHDGSDVGWSDEEIESILGSAILLAIVTALVYFLVLRPILCRRKDGAAAAVAGGAAAGRQRGAGRPGAGAGAGAGATGTLGGGAGGSTTRRRQVVGGGTAVPHLASVGVGPRDARVRAGGGDGPSSSSPVPSILSRGTRRPPHLSPTCPGGLAGSACLLEGIVPFRRTGAVGYEAQLAAAVAAVGASDEGSGSGSSGGDGKKKGGEEGEGEDLLTANRRRRARLFARLLSPAITGATSTTPPPRGSNVVVCIPSVDSSCPRLHRVLWLLATYYNLFVVLCLPPLPVSEVGSVDEAKKEAELMHKLRSEIRSPPPSSSSLPEGSAKVNVDGKDNFKDDDAAGGGNGVPREVLPDHRIVSARSVEGRVAFVRQMNRPEFVLDFDPDIKAQLVRFGFTVLLYGQQEEEKGEGKSGDGGGQVVSSSLGRSLLP